MTSTMKDVALLARVSVATVSRAINSPERVRPDCRARVRKAIEELHYTPNKIARSLKQSRTRTVGILITDIFNPFFSRLLKGAEQVCLESGYAPIICDSQENGERERVYLGILTERRIDGLIYIPASSVDENKLNVSCPIVFVDRFRSAKHDTVKGDNFAGMSLGINHLLSRDYRRIALLSGPDSILSSAERSSAYRDLLAMHNIEYRGHYVVDGSFSAEGGYLATEKLLRLPSPPDSIIAANNFMGVGAVRACKKHSISIPDQLGLVVFDELFSEDLLVPPLTVVAQPAEEMGRAAAQMLLERIDSPVPIDPREVVYEPKLIVRASTRAGG